MAISINSITGAPYIVLSAPIAGDCSFSTGGILTIGDSAGGYTKSIPYASITSAPRVVAVAGTAQVTTCTPGTPFTSTTFSLSISQRVVGGRTYQHLYTVQGDSSSSATEICDALRTAIDGDDVIKITTSGTSTLILTAVAPYNTFIVTGITNTTSTGAWTTITTGTPGVYAINTGAVLLTQGVDDAVAGVSYTSYTISYLNTVPSGVSGIQDSQPQTFTVYANSAASAGYTAFDVYLKANGAVTQAAIYDPIRLNARQGTITTGSVTLAAGAGSTLSGNVFNNSFITTASIIKFSALQGATGSSITVHADTIAAGTCNLTFNNGGGTTTAANPIVFQYEIS